ncbi:MAG: DMT family transporter [Natronospirillum sp.]
MHQGALKSDLWLVLVTVFAALGWVFSAEALVGMTPLLFIGVRFLLAGLLLMVAGGRPLQRLTRLDWRNALLTGAVMGVAMSFWIMGLATADNLGVGAFLASLGVVFVPIVGRLLFGSATTASTWVAVGVAVIGLACLRVEDGFSLSGSDVFFLLAALSFSVHFNLNTRFSVRIPALPLTAIQLTVTGLVALTLSTALEPVPVVPGLDILGWLLASVVIATGLRFWLQVKAQGLATASHAAVILTLEPVWASLFGLWWFGQQMSLLQLLGCGLILSALLVSRWRLLFRRSMLRGSI